jgi:hypothetical protein
MRSLGFAIFGVIALFAAGCTGRVGTVTGEVTVDGKPLEEGTITFSGAEIKADPITEKIVNGKYRVVTSTGKKHVQISSMPVVGRKPEYNHPDAPLVDFRQEVLPERYHSNKSNLNFEVMPGNNTKNWELTSNPD